MRGPGGERYNFVIKQNTNLALKSLMKNKIVKNTKTVTCVRVTFLFGCSQIIHAYTPLLRYPSNATRDNACPAGWSSTDPQAVSPAYFVDGLVG